MLKKSLCLFFLSIISIVAFAGDDFVYDAVVQYHAPCPSKKYEECAKNNREIIINVHDYYKIKNIKQAVFKQEKGDSKFVPDNQHISCGKYVPDDEDWADINYCWNNMENKPIYTLNIKK